MRKFGAKIVHNKSWESILADWVLTGKFLVVLAVYMLLMLFLSQCLPVKVKSSGLSTMSSVPISVIKVDVWQGVPEGIGNKANLMECQKTEVEDSGVIAEVAQEEETLVMSVDVPVLEVSEVATKYASFSLTEEELSILERIVEAEATGGSIDSKIHVVHVILNRCLSDGFPDDVKSVVFEKKQFSPISDGRYYTVEVTDSTREAIQMALTMDDTVDGALYFALLKDVKNAKTRSWFDTLEFVFKDDLGHSFFRE